MKTKILKSTFRYAVAALIAGFIATSGIAHATPLTAVKDTMTRIKAGGSPDVFSDHIITFVMPTGDSFDATGSEDQISIILPTSFVQSGTWLTSELTLAATAGGSFVTDSVVQGTAPQTPDCTGATGGNKVRAAVETNTNIFRFRACPGTSFTGASGTLTISLSGGSPNATIENPTSPGSFLVSIAMEDEGTAAKSTGTAGVIVVSDDQVAIFGEIESSFTFNAGATTTACSTGFSGNGGSISFGTVPYASIASSGTNYLSEPTREHVCLRMTTNAISGYVVAVKSLNGGLKSTSAPTDVILSSTGSITASEVRYGVCVGTVVGDKGRTVSSPDGTDPASVSPYNVVACTATIASGENVGVVDATYRTILTGSSVVSNGFATVRAKIGNGGVGAVIHNDYADSLTFVASSIY